MKNFDIKTQYFANTKIRDYLFKKTTGRRFDVGVHGTELFLCNLDINRSVLQDMWEKQTELFEQNSSIAIQNYLLKNPEIELNKNDEEEIIVDYIVENKLD